MRSFNGEQNKDTRDITWNMIQSSTLAIRTRSTMQLPGPTLYDMTIILAAVAEELKTGYPFLSFFTLKVNKEEHMSHRIAISGSTIMSDTPKLQELFIEESEHIEIGEFENEEAFQTFLKLQQKSDKTFGLHSPLFRNESKYDLLEEFQYKTEQAWVQFEKEVKRLSACGAEYILVHFPYFQDEVSEPNALIEEGLKRLSVLQEKYSLPIVCEPKLGLWKSPKGIQYLNNFPLLLWEKYGVKLCIDIGDYVLAAGENALAMIQKWKDHIKVVHLHNIEFLGEKYIWIPIHPSHENDGIHYPVKDLLRFLAGCHDLYWVLEHTPHSNPSQTFILEGIEWLRNDILSGS
jgi:sugar phosphate isomerase/epimerase